MGLLDGLFGRKAGKGKGAKMAQSGLDEHSVMDGTSMAIDLVCGREVNKKKAPAVSLYLGQNRYFCSPACKRLFRGNPDEYMKHEVHEIAGHG